MWLAGPCRLPVPSAGQLVSRAPPPITFLNPSHRERTACVAPPSVLVTLGHCPVRGEGGWRPQHEVSATLFPG